MLVVSKKEKGYQLVEIGIKISQARREQGITQVELAAKMSVTRQTVSRWESGVAYPDIEKVVDLSNILHVSCDYLLRTEENLKRIDQADQADQASTSSITRLLSNLEGKKIRIQFYDDEEDMDIIGETCRVEGFEGNWVRVIILNKKEERKKILAISSILSFEIIEEG
jgi:transcriptional regulator with XRE-family HTH domain